ncbi:unnamed protein product [Linum trigynum]|uniref:Uncharacterized protein n=1 Tax=Linum trigynum TaxID=586398 RepID=A0AAV2E1A5_9ROSI
MAAKAAPRGREQYLPLYNERCLLIRARLIVAMWRWKTCSREESNLRTGAMQADDGRMSAGPLYYVSYLLKQDRTGADVIAWGLIQLQGS